MQFPVIGGYKQIDGWCLGEQLGWVFLWACLAGQEAER